MWIIRKGLILSAVLLSLWLSPLLSGSRAQAEQVFMISEMELTQLEQNLTALEQHSKSKQILLDKQAKQLNEAQEQLKIANEQIKKSQALNEQTQNSLERANQYLKEYEKEAERKIRIKTRQRNLWIMTTVVAVGAAISRR
jgi:septal ring factor EnvC (AmiA/AmiB activator)|nr:MAG TPA: SECRETED 45 KDA PROTEIN CYCLE, PEPTIDOGLYCAN, CHAP, CELL [Caudoviricetes sp.]